MEFFWPAEHYNSGKLSQNILFYIFIVNPKFLAVIFTVRNFCRIRFPVLEKNRHKMFRENKFSKQFPSQQFVPFTLFKMLREQGEGKKFSPVTSTSVWINPKNFLTCFFSPFLHWCKFSRPYLVPVPSYWT